MHTRPCWRTTLDQKMGFVLRVTLAGQTCSTRVCSLRLRLRLRQSGGLHATPACSIGGCNRPAQHAQHGTHGSLDLYAGAPHAGAPQRSTPAESNPEMQGGSDVPDSSRSRERGAPKRSAASPAPAPAQGTLGGRPAAPAAWRLLTQRDCWHEHLGYPRHVKPKQCG